MKQTCQKGSHFAIVKGSSYLNFKEAVDFRSAASTAYLQSPSSLDKRTFWVALIGD